MSSLLFVCNDNLIVFFTTSMYIQQYTDKKFKKCVYDFFQSDLQMSNLQIYFSNQLNEKKTDGKRA